MSSFSFKKTLQHGIALALPLGVVGYVFIRLLGILEKIVSPLAKKAGIENIAGELTLTILALFIMLLLILLLGLLMRFAFVSQVSRQLEDLILKLAPSLNHLKMMAAEKLEIENASSKWKPVLMFHEDSYFPAYIIEETNEWITFAKIKTPSTVPEETGIVKKMANSYIPISMKQLMGFNKQFGKGYISLLDEIPPAPASL